MEGIAFTNRLNLQHTFWLGFSSFWGEGGGVEYLFRTVPTPCDNKPGYADSRRVQYAGRSHMMLFYTILMEKNIYCGWVIKCIINSTICKY